MEMMLMMWLGFVVMMLMMWLGREGFVEMV